MRIEGVPSSPYSSPRVVRPSGAVGDSQATGASFGEQLVNAIDEINTRQAHAGELIQQVATGQIQDVHKAMIAMEHAGLTLDFSLQVRNKVLDAYKEIMETQI